MNPTVPPPHRLRLGRENELRLLQRDELRARTTDERLLRSEVNHAADAVLRLHQLEAAVDLVQRQLVGDERLDVDLARQPALDQLRHLVAALDSAERRAGDAAAG